MIFICFSGGQVVTAYTIDGAVNYVKNHSRRAGFFAALYQGDSLNDAKFVKEISVGLVKLRMLDNKIVPNICERNNCRLHNMWKFQSSYL